MLLILFSLLQAVLGQRQPTPSGRDYAAMMGALQACTQDATSFCPEEYARLMQDLTQARQSIRPLMGCIRQHWEELSTDCQDSLTSVFNNYNDNNNLPEEEQSSGCCFTIGLGAMRAPCCLETAEGVAREECYALHEEVMGGKHGWTPTCPSTAEEAFAWIQRIEASMNNDDREHDQDSHWEEEEEEEQEQDGEGEGEEEEEEGVVENEREDPDTDVNDSLEEEPGCCFTIGLGAMRVPCCLESTRGLSKEDCYAQHEQVMGGKHGWAPSCPSTAEEAFAWIQKTEKYDDQDGQVPLPPETEEDYAEEAVMACKDDALTYCAAPGRARGRRDHHDRMDKEDGYDHPHEQKPGNKKGWKKRDHRDARGDGEDGGLRRVMSQRDQGRGRSMNQDKMHAMLQELWEACQAEARSFCGWSQEEPPAREDMPPMRSCMREHWDDLSSTCQDKIQKMKHKMERMTRHGAPPPYPPYVVEACHEDAEALCADEEGPFERRECMKAKWESLSEECQDAVEQWAREMEEHKKEMESHKDEHWARMAKHGEAVKACLLEQPDGTLSPSCSAFLHSGKAETVSNAVYASMAGYDGSEARTFPIVVVSVVSVLLFLSLAACVRQRRKNSARVHIAPAAVTEVDESEAMAALSTDVEEGELVATVEDGVQLESSELTTSDLAA